MRMIDEALLRLMTWRPRVSDERGQTLAEYGLIMAVISVAVVTLAVVTFRGAIVTAFDSATTCLTGGDGCS